MALNSYIYGEVTGAFDRSVTAGSRAIREAKKNFNLIISKRHNVEFIDHEAIGQMDVQQARDQQTIQLLGMSWGIQPKDVPIVLLAEKIPNQSIIYTTDRDLSDFSPASEGITEIAMEFIPQV